MALSRLRRACPPEPDRRPRTRCSDRSCDPRGAGQHGPRRRHDGRHVQAHGSHQHAGDDLRRSTDQHESVEGVRPESSTRLVSATSSRLGREKFMPAWFIGQAVADAHDAELERHAAGAAHAALTGLDHLVEVHGGPARPRCRSWRLPTNGRVISASVTPSARNSERCGARATPKLDLVASHVRPRLRMSRSRVRPRRLQALRPPCRRRPVGLIMIPVKPCPPEGSHRFRPRPGIGV